MEDIIIILAFLPVVVLFIFSKWTDATSQSKKIDNNKHDDSNDYPCGPAGPDGGGC